jgi:hypothetical protein
MSEEPKTILRKIVLINSEARRYGAKRIFLLTLMTKDFISEALSPPGEGSN